MCVEAERANGRSHEELLAHGLQRVRQLRCAAHHQDWPSGRVQKCNH